MNSVKLLGQRLSVSDFDPQVAEFQVRGSIPSGFIALGTPVTEVAGEVCPANGNAGQQLICATEPTATVKS
jgi:hypothetical protein